MAGPVEREHPTALLERLGDRREIGPVMQRRVQQHDRRPGALIGVGNHAE